jgi:dipeptidyl aminopeptidase/acylaminoacyl peptidase
VAPFDFARNAPGETRVLAPGFDFAGRLLGQPDGQGLLGVRVDAEVEQTVWFDPALQALQARVDEALPGRVNRLQCRRCGHDDAVVLVRSFSDRDPGELLLFQPAAPGASGERGRWQRVGRVRPEIAPAQMGVTRLHRIRARDGRDLPVWVTRPPGATAARPAVVLVHGGPWVRGRHWRWEALPQFLATRGYVVIEPEFRGSDGYGREHLRAGFRQWGQAMQDDVADALLWARREGLAGEAACIAGGSYGGYSTLMGLVRHPELYRCGSAWVAVTDPFLFLEGSWWVRDDISGRGRRHSLPQWVGDVQRDREMLLANSPLAQAARITRPLQLVWGSDDLRVPIAHGQRLLQALREQGRPPEWIVYDNEAHGWRSPANQADFARRLEAFLARHLGTAEGREPGR